MRGPGKQGRVTAFFSPSKEGARKKFAGKEGTAKRLLVTEEIGDSSESD